MILAMMFLKRSQPVWRVTPKTLIALCSYAKLGLRIEWRIEVWGFWPKVKLREDCPLGLEFKVGVDEGPEFW